MAMKDQSKQTKDRKVPCFLKRLSVRDLFDIYSYDLRFATSAEPESVQLSLLYGDNGSGKTTILNLIYHLLSPEPYEGHRSFIGRCPFRMVEITLSNGVIVCAKRDQG